MKEELMIPVGIATIATPIRQIKHPNNLPNNDNQPVALPSG